MELIVLLAVILATIINILVLRLFFKKISDKLNFLLVPQETETTTPLPTKSSFSIPSMKPLFNTTGNPGLFDPASPNKISEENETLDLSEQNFTGLPKGIKIEVEGGDTHAPYGAPIK